MKQTNNAIKFLMAQYRAIFKHAYLKGIASAVVLTTGLAAGASANAATISDFDALQNAINTANGNLEIDGDSSSGYVLQIVDAKSPTDLNGTVTITSGSMGSLFFGASTDSVAVTSDNFNLTISVGDSKGNTDGLIVTAGTSDATKNASVDIGSIEVTKGTLALAMGKTSQSGTVTVTANTITIGTDQETQQDNQKGFVALGYDDGASYAAPSGEGIITLGSGVTINDGKVIQASQTTLNQSGVIQFLGDSGSGNVEKVVFKGELIGNGGLLDFSKGSGQLESFGTNVEADVKVGADQIAKVVLKDEVKTTDVNEGLLQFTSGRIELANKGSAGTANGGQILVDQGILAIEDNIVLTTTDTASATTEVGHILVSGSDATNPATLRIDSGILTSFLNADKVDGDTEPADIAGAVIVSGANSTLEFTDEVVDLYKLASGDATGQNYITFSSGNTVASGSLSVVGGNIKADKLVVSNNTTTTKSRLDLSKAVLVANELTLGSADYDGTNAITISGSKVQDKLDLQASGESFTLTGVNDLARDYYVRKDGENTLTLNEEGIITGVDYNISGASAVSLNVKSGKWTTTGQDITLGQNGTLSVTSVNANDGQASPGTATGTILNNGNPSYLTINGGKLTIGDSSNDGTIQVTGASGADATLDLTQVDELVLTSGNITVEGKAIAYTDFKDSEAASDFYADAFKNRVGYGILKINGEDFDKLTHQDPAKNKVALTISGDGVVRVIGSSATGEIDVDKLVTGTADSGEVGFDGLGYLVLDGQLDLFDGNKSAGEKDEGTAADVSGINIGSGTITADNVKLTNYARKTDKSGNKTVEASKLVSGTIEVSKGFETNSSTLNIGDASATAKANLNLNAGLNQAGTLSMGSADHTINVIGNSNSGAALNVQTGSWSDTALDIYATGTDSQLTVGLDDDKLINLAKQQSDDTKTVYVAEFTADNFNAKADAGSSNVVLSVAKQSKATFNTMQLADANKVDVDGKLVIEGREVAAPASGETADVAYVNPNTEKTASNTAGISLGSSTFTITGSSANLEFGKTATDALIDPDGNTAEGAKSKYALTKGGIDKTAFNVTKFGSITFNFEPTTMTADDVKFLVDNVLMDSGSDKTSYLVLNNADWNITPVSRTDGNLEYTWESVKPFVQAVGGQATTDKLKSALISGIGSNEADFRGHYGAAQVDSDSKNALTLAGPTSFHNAGAFGEKFVQDKSGNVLGVTFGNAYVSLELENGGQIGKITGFGNYGESDQNNLVFTGTGVTTVLGDITKINEFTVENDTAVHGDVSVNYLDLASSMQVLGANGSGGKVTLNGGFIDSEGSLTVQDLYISDLPNTNAKEKLWVFGNAKIANNLSVASEHSLNILNGKVSTKDLTLSDKASVYVGYEPAANAVDDPDTEEFDESKSYTGMLEVTGSAVFKGAYGIFDPEYGMHAATVAFNNLSGASTTTPYSAGTLDGRLLIGKNTVQGIGVANTEELLDKVAPYMSATNSLSEELSSILYVGKNFSIDKTTGGLVLTGSSASDFVDYYNKNNKDGAADLTADKPVLDNTVFLGSNTAILVAADAMTKANVSNNSTTAVIGFDSSKGNVVADGGDIIIDGDVRASKYQIFSNASIEYIDGSAYQIAEEGSERYEENINVSTENNFLQGVVDDDGTVQLGVNSDRSIMAGASDPVYTTLVAYARGYNGDDDTDESAKLYDGYKKSTTSGQTESTTTPEKNYNYNNDVLQYSISTGNGAAAEQVARLGVYGGSVQAALTAGATTYDAVSARMGVGAKTGSITFADNGQGAGLWVTPVYKNHDSDGFEAQGLSYGADMDMYGVALGGDYTLGNGLRVGAAFNVGSGDADGQGAGAGVSNDFDYYGFTVYGGYTMDKLSVVADVSYTVVDNDVEGNNGYGKVSTSMDTTNLSFGVTGQYTFNLNAVDVIPHAGLRYTYIDMDDYNVKDVDGDEVARYAGDSMSVFSIPVGVTFSKEIVSGEWTVKPSFDLTLTANVGDDSIDGSVNWGIDNLTTNLESEVIDSFTYGATLGVSAKTGNFSMGFGVNYTGASSADEYGVSANARFVF